MFVADMPPHVQERVICSVQAAYRYQIPANIVLAVAEKEGGRPGQWVKNKNGTFDVGSMQANTLYLKDLAQYGITADDVAQGGCYPYDLAAWRIRRHIVKDSGDIWTRAANYHSRTPKYNAIYREDLMRKADKWGAWLMWQQQGQAPQTPAVLDHRSTIAKTKTVPSKSLTFDNPRSITVSSQ